MVYALWKGKVNGESHEAWVPEDGLLVAGRCRFCPVAGVFCPCPFKVNSVDCPLVKTNKRKGKSDPSDTMRKPFNDYKNFYDWMLKNGHGFEPRRASIDEKGIVRIACDNPYGERFNIMYDTAISKYAVDGDKMMQMYFISQAKSILMRAGYDVGNR